jgi:hypothetical protein
MIMKTKDKKLKRKKYRDKNFDPVENTRIVEAQHAIHNIFRALVTKNTSAPYIKDPIRRRKVVQHYLEKFGLIGTSVEDYWRSDGGCILIGKDW